MQSFINLRFEQIEKRLSEIDLLLRLAAKSQKNNELYQTLCRSAHVLLVSHFEGLYREICRDVLDDINSNTKFTQVPKKILHTHCNYFIQDIDSKSSNNIRIRLAEAFKDHPSSLKLEPFLFVENRNPAPVILETILSKFGIDDFFWSLKGSGLDIVFQDSKTETLALRRKLLKYLKKGTLSYPYKVKPDIYNPIPKPNERKTRTLWEDFLNDFLNDRHSIIHGHVMDNPYDHEGLIKAKMKIEILILVFILNICASSEPLKLNPSMDIE